jgi:signal transduction histidine kinase
MFPQSASSPDLILARIKEAKGKEIEKAPIISGLTEWAWVRREFIEQTVAKAIEGERVRLGHELHDNINQMLAVILVYLSLLHPADSDEKSLRDKAEHILQMAIEEIRSLSHRLVKDSPLREGFIAAATGLVAEFRDARLFNITFTCGSREVESMDQSKKLALYRILQEQLNNIVKYSHAKNVHICLDSDEKGVRLTIEDDGVGFNKLTVQKGIGLTGIYKKAELCNGSVELLTSPGHGCVLKVTAPQGVSEN